MSLITSSRQRDTALPPQTAIEQPTAFNDLEKNIPIPQADGRQSVEHLAKKIDTTFKVTAPRIKLADILKSTIDILEKGHPDKAKGCLKRLPNLSKEAEGRIYHHFYEIQKAKKLIKRDHPNYGREVFNGNTSLCKTPASIQQDRIAAMRATIQEHDGKIVLAAIDQLSTFDNLEMNLPIPQADGRQSVEHLAKRIDTIFKDTQKKQFLIDFDDCSTIKTGHKLLRIEVKKDTACQDDIIAKAIFSKGCCAGFTLRYNRKSQECTIDYAYRRGLPNWIKIGEKSDWLSQEKGIPTPKVILSLLINALHINQHDVKKIRLISLSAQTSLDVIHSVAMEERSLPEAFARSASSLLAKEVGDMLGGVTRLTNVTGAYDKSGSTYKLSTFYFLEDDLKLFKGQPKIKELLEQTQCDFSDDNQPYYPTLFHMDFSFAPRIKLADILEPTVAILINSPSNRAKDCLKQVPNLSKETESRIYRHFYEIQKAKKLIKRDHPNYGREVFNGNTSLCKASTSIQQDRIAAIEATILEHDREIAVTANKDQDEKTSASDKKESIPEVDPFNQSTDYVVKKPESANVETTVPRDPIPKKWYQYPGSLTSSAYDFTRGLFTREQN